MPSTSRRWRTPSRHFCEKLTSAACFFRREKLLTALIILMIALFFVDRDFPNHLPELLEYRALSMITSFMIISSGIKSSRVLNSISRKLIAVVRKNTYFLVIAAATVSGGIAAVLTNDAALFVFMPFIITLSETSGVDLAKMTIAIAMAVNVGSALTPIGNPQNIIIWQFKDVDFVKFAAVMAPFTVISIAVLAAFIFLMFRDEHVHEISLRLGEENANKRLFYLSLALLIVDVVLAELNLQVYALLITVICMASFAWSSFKAVDFPFIAVFALLFADFGELSLLAADFGFIPNLTGKPEIIALSALLSQAISNVPATITLMRHISSWEALAVGVNLGGVGFITGSMANIIALRFAKFSMKEFHKYSLLYAAVLATIFYLLSLANIYP